MCCFSSYCRGIISPVLMLLPEIPQILCQTLPHDMAYDNFSVRCVSRRYRVTDKMTH